MSIFQIINLFSKKSITGGFSLMGSITNLVASGTWTFVYFDASYVKHLIQSERDLDNF